MAMPEKEMILIELPVPSSGLRSCTSASEYSRYRVGIWIVTSTNAGSLDTSSSLICHAVTRPTRCPPSFTGAPGSSPSAPSSTLKRTMYVA